MVFFYVLQKNVPDFMSCAIPMLAPVTRSLLCQRSRGCNHQRRVKGARPVLLQSFDDLLGELFHCSTNGSTQDCNGGNKMAKFLYAYDPIS